MRREHPGSSMRGRVHDGVRVMSMTTAVVLTVACSGSPDTRAAAAVKSNEATLSLVAQRGTITAPDSVHSGWTRVHLDEKDGRHIVVVFRLPANSTADDMKKFVDALDSAPATPSMAAAMGGPEVGSANDVAVQLVPGTYVLACVSRSDDKHRHAINGEARLLHVRAASWQEPTHAEPPTHTQVVRMGDFAFTAPEQWAPGVHTLRIENSGKQDHQLRLARLRDGTTMAAWLNADDPDTLATTVAGMARLGPGEVAFLPLDLKPGSYVAYCLVTDPPSGKQHIELGMLKSIIVM